MTPISEQERGEAFEEFCQAFFVLQKDFYQARNIWRFQEIPQNILNQIGLHTFQDRGIDGLLQHHDGTFTAYQAKFRSDRADTPSQRELSTFYMVSDRVNFRLVISNVQNLPSLATERKDHGHILVDTLLELSPDFFQCLKDYVCSDYLHHEPPPVPKPFQIEALDAIFQGFKVASRGQAILACGSGKTLLAKWTVDRLGSKRILVMFPSLALVRQTLGEWYRAQSGTFRYICICSDPTVDVYREEDEWETQPSELDVKVSTNAKDLVVFFSNDETVPQVAFSTYQSGDVIVEALKNPALENFHFDLVICDEAHRLAGAAGRHFSIVLDDNLVKAKYRLFMTATPKILSPRLSEKDSTESNEICSMDDPAIFGPVFYRFPFSKAIQQGVICDYRIVVIGVSEEEILHLIREGGTVQIEDSETWKAEVLAQRIALCKAIANYGIAKIFTFHNRVSAAAHFVDVNTPDSFPSVLKKFNPNLQYTASHIEGKMSAGIRNNILRTFALSARGVVSNARCLGEGVNVPIVDGIFFADPRKSVIDIVQATGRALRKLPGKDCAYIIIPVLVHKGEDVEQILGESKFDTVWHVLSAMASQDERLDTTIKEARIKQGERAIPRLGDSEDSFHSEFLDTQTILMGFPKHIPFSVYQKAFSLEAIEKLGERWHLRFGALKAYVQHHGREPSQDEEFKGIKIGVWLNAQRHAHKKKKLSQERVNLLQDLDIDLTPKRDFQEQSWEEHLECCKKFLEVEWRLPSQGEEMWFGKESWEEVIKEKMKYENSSMLSGLNLCQEPAEKKLLKVGNWLTHQRQLYKQGKLPKERIEKMEKELKLTWDPIRENWERNFAAYKAYVEKTGKQPQKQTKHKGLAIGNWITNSIRKSYKEGKLSDEQIKLFESLGMVWDPKKIQARKRERWEWNVAAYKDYVEKTGKQPKKNSWHKGQSIGHWLSDDVRPNKDKMTSEQVHQFDALGIDWDFKESDELRKPSPKIKTLVQSSEMNQSREDQWVSNYVQCKEYIKEFGKGPSPEVVYKGQSIGTWFRSQANLLEKGELSLEKAERFKFLNIYENLHRLEPSTPILHKKMRNM